MTDAQMTAEQANQEADDASPREGPEAEAAIAAMKAAGDEINAALIKAFPALLADHQSGGPHPLRLVAMILCKQQWIFTETAIEAEGKTQPDDVFFRTAHLSLNYLVEGLQNVGNTVAEMKTETLQ